MLIGIEYFSNVSIQIFQSVHTTVVTKKLRNLTSLNRDLILSPPPPLSLSLCLSLSNVIILYKCHLIFLVAVFLCFLCYDILQFSLSLSLSLSLFHSFISHLYATRLFQVLNFTLQRYSHFLRYANIATKKHYKFKKLW